MLNRESQNKETNKTSTRHAIYIYVYIYMYTHCFRIDGSIETGVVSANHAIVQPSTLTNRFRYF